jgi:hypothetical protein
MEGNDGYRLERGILVPKQLLRLEGRYSGKIVRAGKVIDEFEADNLIVNQGLDHILGVEFTGVSQISSWYLAPFTGNYVPVATDTAASIPGNATEATAYSAVTRVPFAGVESGQQATNSASPAVFVFTSILTIYGAFLSSASTKSSTSGILFSAAQFSTPKSVGVGDQLLLTYTAAAAG